MAASPEAADAEASPVTALVTVERTSIGETSRSEVVARFVRSPHASPHAGMVSDDALAMVGASLDLPAEGACSKLPMPAANGAAENVELLDVGAVSLDVDAHPLPLAARRVPDVVDLVSGVVYTTREASPLPAKGHFALHVAGATDPDVSPIAVDANVAGEPADARLVNADGEPLELAWTPSDATGDVVYVDVLAHGTAFSRCTFSDAAGRAVLANVLITGADDGALAVHRVHREPFRAHGVAAGEIRFDFARVVPLRH